MPPRTNGYRRQRRRHGPRRWMSKRARERWTMARLAEMKFTWMTLPAPGGTVAIPLEDE